MVATASARFQRDFVVRPLALEIDSAAILRVVAALGKPSFHCASQQSLPPKGGSGLARDTVALEQVFEGAEAGELAGVADLLNVEVARQQRQGRIEDVAVAGGEFDACPLLQPCLE